LGSPLLVHQKKEMIQPHIIILTIVGLAFIPEVIWIFQLFRSKAQEGNLPKVTLRINIIVFGFGIILTGLAIVYDVNFVNYKAPMEYKNWQQINWSDFRAINRPNHTLYGSQNFAFICSNIDVSQSSEQAIVITLFHPSRSYTFSEESAGQDLLQHELYHLHITEYVAREIRREFSMLKSEAANTEFINAYLQRARYLQSTYDEETSHGLLLGKQRKWQKKIDSCLLSLENYTEPVIRLK
jgi:hypothetical protein